MKNKKASIIILCFAIIIIITTMEVLLVKQGKVAASAVEETDPLIGMWEGQSLSTGEEYADKDMIDLINENYGYKLEFECGKKYCTLMMGDGSFSGEWQKFGDDAYWMIVDDKPVATLAIYKNGELFFTFEDTTITFTKSR